MGQSNQVHQLKLFLKIALTKNSAFCEDMSKSKNAIRITFVIYVWLKCLIFLSFWLELCKTLESDGQEIKITTHTKKFHFWVKCAVFSENENDNLNNSDFCYSWTTPCYTICFLLFWHVFTKFRVFFLIWVIIWSNFNWWTWFDCLITSHLYHIPLA